MTPATALPRPRITPSRPQPNSGVWISRAYVGLTVVTRSANIRPAFMKFSWPWNSRPAGDISRDASPSIGQSCIGEQAWKAMLCTV